MEKNEQILDILKRLKENKPAKMFKKVSNDLDSGVRFVLMFLCENENVYASTISEKMGISRARVGILLKKMENKNLIYKIDNSNDARIQVIAITENGKKMCEQIKVKIRKHISNLIDKIGYNTLIEFLDVASKIKNVLKGGGYID